MLNITSGSMEVTMDEIGEITDYVQEEAGYGTDLIWGNCNDETLGDKIIITLIATGFEGGNSRKKEINEKAQAASRQEARRVPLEKPFSVVIEEDEFEIEFESQVSSNVFEFDDIPASHTSSNHYSEDKEERKNQGSTTLSLIHISEPTRPY